MAPKYLVVFHPVSAGQNGSLLGADEEEIVMLVFIVIDTEAQQIVAEKRYMVKPRTADINENVLSDQCRNEFGLTEDQVKRGELLETVIEQFHDWVERFLTTSSKVPFLGTVGTPVWPKLEDSSRYRNWIGPNIVLVCDGQLPLRQCFHPEVCNKSIDLPPYYFSFFDLRKEFCKAFSCEPVHGIKDMLSVLGKEPVTLPGDQGMAEAENMAVVVQGMLEKSYDFPEPEEIGVRLEPGICSRNDVVDSNCVVRARGLPWQSSDQDIARFFRGLNVSKGGVALCLSQQGRRNGEALCRFISQEHRDMALKRHKHHMGSRYIEVYRATGEDFVNVAGGNNNEAQAFLSRNGQVIVRMRGLPYDCTAKQVVEFFAGKASSAPSSGKVKEEPMTPPSEPADESDAAGASDGGVVVSSRDSDSGRGDSQDEGEHESSSASDPNACHVLDGEAGVLFVKKTDGRATGDAFVMFGTEEDGGKALAKHRQCIGSRYIELFRSTTAEVQQILNRPVEPRAMDPSAQVAAAVAAASQPSLAVPPVAQLPLLPQQIITAGVRKDCIRLRGLPYEAQVENILEFLGEHAKRIAYRGVHMIYNAQQQPSGEAFIQMDSEQAAYLAASQKHYKNMTFGKKQRYIEVFQCSGQDMQLVLSGGVPQSTAGPAAGAGPALLSPGGTLVASFPYVTTAGVGHNNQLMAATSQSTAAALSSALAAPRPTGPAYYAPAVCYWPFPSPPVSPTFYGAPCTPIATGPPPVTTVPQEYVDIQRGCDGRPTGEALVTFPSHAEAHEAIRLKNHNHMGTRYIELFMTS